MCVACVLIESPSRAQPLAGPCNIDFEVSCPNTAPLCGADFDGSGGCIFAKLGNCYSSGTHSFMVTDAMPLTINLSGDLLKLSVFFAGLDAGTGTMTFFDISDVEVDSPLSTNGNCRPFPMLPLQQVTFSRAVRRIEVIASGTLWIDDFTVNPGVCGNGTTESGEICDDGNTASGDGCEANCTLTGCGNGTTEFGEQCDDGNSASGDGCDANCTLTACGNGIVTVGEQCDDGNTVSGDSCDEFCQFECAAPAVIGGISSRYIQIIPDAGVTGPVAFFVECGSTNGELANGGWVQLIQVDYFEDPAGTVRVNIGSAGGGGYFEEPSGTARVNVSKATATCEDADFLTADQWTSNGNNALYVTGLPVCASLEGDGYTVANARGLSTVANAAHFSRPTVTARCLNCAGADLDPVRPTDPMWAFCDSNGDGQTTFFNDLFKQFANTAAGGGGAGFLGPDPGIEVDTQGNFPTVPDQQVSLFGDIFQCFLATTVGGGDTWTGPTCP